MTNGKHCDDEHAKSDAETESENQMGVLEELRPPHIAASL
jgi:hypothetical protein